MKNKLYKYLVLLILIISFACENTNEEVYRDDLPLPKPFSVTLNLNLVSYQSLQFQNHLYLDEGLKGIIVVKRSDGTYAAFERTCPFEPEKDCSIISIQSGLQYLECECGQAFYNFEGFPTRGPSPRKLRQYYSELNGSTLYIDNTIL